MIDQITRIVEAVDIEYRDRTAEKCKQTQIQCGVFKNVRGEAKHIIRIHRIQDDQYAIAEISDHA